MKVLARQKMKEYQHPWRKKRSHKLKSFPQIKTNKLTTNIVLSKQIKSWFRAKGQKGLEKNMSF